MASMGIDGLVSGLDTTSLINSLMTAEAAPQTLLKTQQTNTNSLITAFQALNTKVASLADAAKTAAKATSWQALSSTSSASSVSATASSTAQPGSVTFTTNKLAASQVSLVDPAALGTGTTFTVKVGSTLTEVTSASSDPRDIAAALNKTTAAGVTATTVRTNSTEPATYKLQLSGRSTGTDSAFTVYFGSKADVEAGTVTAIPLSEVRGASDAQITLFAGTSNETVLTSATNTFTGLTAGVDVTISKIETDPVTVNVARNNAALTKLASDLVSQVGLVLSEIDSRTQTTTTNNDDGTTSVTGGLFSGESSVRGLDDQISSALSMPIGGGHSPSEIGITLNKDGTFAFDATKFAAALDADPAKVQAWTTELANRVASVATSTSDPIDGSLTRQITGQKSLATDLGDQIADWDRRLALRREGLQATYSALEVSLSNMKSQSSWLASQLSSLA